MSDGLKPCPFCGGEVMPVAFNDYSGETRYEPELDEWFDYFKCYGCDTIFAHDEPNNDFEKHKEWWNRRVNDE